MTPSNSRRLAAMLVALLLVATTNGQTIVTWGNGNGGWHTGSNWVGGSTPNANDTAAIGGGNVTVDSTTSIARLTLSGGNIGGAGSLTITGTGSTWTAGSMNRAGMTTLGGGATLEMNSGNNHDLNGTPFVNSGTLTWNAGHVRGGNGASITNNGTFVDLNTSGYSVHNPGSGYGFGGSFRFINNGTYVRDTTGSTPMDVPFDHNGIVDVKQGAIQFRAGGTMSGTATMAAAAGTTIEFTDGFSVAAGAALTGAGSYVHSGGTMTLSGGVAVGKYTQTGGTLAGNQTLTGTFDWNGGTWNSSAAATTTIATGATLNLGNSANHDFNFRQITNQGTVNWDSGYIRAGNGGLFTNTGTFNDRNVSGYSIHNPGSGYGYGGTFTFLNNGMYVRNVGGTTYFDVPFDNTGTLDLKLGNVEFRGGGTLSGTGKIIAASGTNVYFRTDYTMADGSALSGAGNYELTNGTLSAPGTLKVASFNQTGGRLSGSNTLDGTFNWNGGDWNAAGASSTTVGTTGILNLGNGANHDFNYRNITNQGVVNWNSGYMRAGNGSVFTNSGTFNDLNGSSYTIHNPGSGYGFGGTFVFVNDGTYERNATGTTAFDVPFNNNGILKLMQGSIEFRAGGTLSATGTMDAAAGTNLYFRTDYTIANGSSLTGAGNYELSGGTLTVPGILSMTTFKQSGGALAGSNTLQGTFNWNGGNWNAAAAGSSTTISTTGVLNLGNHANHDFNFRSITNEGIVNWSSGYLRAGNGSEFTNTGTFNDLNASSYSVHNPGSGYGFGGTFSFVNNGSYIRDAAGTTTFDVPFHNQQSIDVRQGNLQFNSGGTLTGSATIAAALNSNVYFTNGFSIANGASLTGAGTYWLTGGTLSLAGVIGVSTFHQTGGTLAGSNTLNGVFSWDGGNWNDAAPGNATTIGGTATLNMGNSANHDFNYRQVTNNGVVNWTTGYIRAGNGSVFTNNGTFNDLNGSSYSIHNPGSGYGFGGTFRFVNNGSYIRDATGITYVDVPFDNNGVINVRAGEMQFRAGGTLASAGTISAATSTNVVFTNGYTIENGASLGGAGKYALTGGTLTLAGSINVGLFAQTGGRLDGTSVINGTFDWHGGDWNAAATTATTTIGGTATLNLGNGANHDFNFRQITNNGTVNWQSGYIRAGNGSVFTNTGTFNDQNLSGYSMHNPGSGYGFGGTFSFVNQGTYTRAVGGTTYIDIPFTNQGTVNLTGGDLLLRAGGTMTATSVVNGAANTRLYLASDYTILDGARFAGDGAFIQNAGTLTLNGALKATSFNWAGGNWNAASSGLTTTVASGTTLNLVDGANHDFNARGIVNEGVVNWYSGYIRAGNGSVFTNSATFNDHNVSSYTVHNPSFGGTFSFVNNGTYVRDVGGTTFFDVPFHNNATLNLASGEMQLRAGGTMSATSVANASSGTRLYFTNGYTLADGAVLAGQGQFIQTGGTLTVNGTLQASSFDWSGGDWNDTAAGATTTVGTTSVLNLGNGANHDFNYRSITNAGTTNWYSGYLRAGNGSVFTNTGVFNDANASGYTVHNPSFGGTFSFVNNGTYVRNVGGTTYFDTTFNNNGTLNLQQGAIEVRAGGTMGASSVVNASTGTNLYFTTDYTLLSGAQLLGAGTFWQTGGTFNAERLAASHFNWDNGNWNSASATTTTVAAGSILNLTSGANKDLRRRSIVNQGVVNWNAGYIRGGDGSSFVNAGVFNDLNVSGYTVHRPAEFGTGFTFTNSGSYLKSTGGTTTFDIPFTNSGGTVSVAGGLLRFTSGYTHTSGTLALSNNATAKFDLGLTLTAGTLTGAGTIQGNVENRGLIGPGTGAGTLAITGNLTLISTSTLLIELGGTSQGTGYDFLSVSGNAVAGGTLALTFLNGFQASVGPTSTFTILTGTAGLTGAFGNAANGGRLFTSDGLGSFLVNYGAGSTFGANSVVLSSFVAVPEPSTWAMLGIGALLVMFQLRRRV